MLIAACLLAQSAARAAAQEGDHLIAPHDLLTVTVWEQPDLSGKFTVDADGTFAFPLIGRVKAAGLSLQGVEAEIRSRLAGRFFKNPQVSVAIEPYHGEHVNVLGEVRQAGSYPLAGSATLLDTLARAGSTTERAGAVVVITRAPRATGTKGTTGTNGSDGSAPDQIRVNLHDLQNGAVADNIILHDGDTVFVPPAETFYVSGHVRNPGAFPLQGQTTVLQAVALAGGLTERGSDRRVQIIREVDGKRTTLKAKLDDVLQPGDTVVVRERLF